jgi:chromate transport protein ChrA
MNDKWGLFQKFLITQEQQLSLTDFLMNSMVIIVLAIILEFTYIRAARTVSNRRQFAGTFLLIAFTTMLIISIVKSSLALSLGLVGALSIVRFRAAIKEPEELAYIFFAISIGLGLGANQTIVVLEAFVIAMFILWGRYLIKGKSTRQNLYLNFSASKKDISLNQVTKLVKDTFGKYHLKRYDESESIIEASFMVDSPKAENLQLFSDNLSKISDKARVSFVESKSF